VLSEHIGNLILQEIFTLKKDIKIEIQAMGIKIASLINENIKENFQKNGELSILGVDVSSNFDSNCNVTNLPSYYGKEVDDIDIAGSYVCENQTSGSDMMSISDSINQEYDAVPIFECEGLTETNLMTSPSDDMTSSDIKELPACSAQVSVASINCVSIDNCQNQKDDLDNSNGDIIYIDEIDAVIASSENTQITAENAKSIIGTSRKNTQANEKIFYSKTSLENEDNSSLLMLDKRLPCSSVAVVKYEDTKDLSFSISTGMYAC